MTPQVRNNKETRRYNKLSDYATRPTRMTLFFRTFLPWQFIRFLVINAKIIRMTLQNEKLH